jgi:Rieske Fe-S protein
VCRVSRAVTICVLHKQIFISNTLHEDYVGLDDVDDGVYDLFFCFCHSGRYELPTNKIHDILLKVPMTRVWADHQSNL